MRPDFAAPRPVEAPSRLPATPAATPPLRTDSRVVTTEADVARVRCAGSPTRSSSTTRAPPTWCVLGIPTRGVALAQPPGRLVIARSRATRCPSARLDVTMHRDDLRRQPTRSPMHTDDPAGRHRRQGRRARRRRALLRPHRPGRPRRAVRPRPPARRAPGRAGRPRPPRAADPGRPRGQEPAHLQQREGRACGSASPTTSRTRSPSPEARPDDTSTTHRHPRAQRARIAAPAVVRRPRPRRGPRHPRHRRGDARRAAARGQEAPDAARPHRRQPVLRGLHPHPQLASRSPASGCPPTSSTSAARARRRPRASRCATPC